MQTSVSIRPVARTPCTKYGSGLRASDPSLLPGRTSSSVAKAPYGNREITDHVCRVDSRSRKPNRGLGASCSAAQPEDLARATGRETRQDQLVSHSPTRAAVELGRRLGIFVAEPMVLADTNNVVVWLSPSMVVAKVGAGHHDRLGQELAVVHHLVAAGAPVVAPLDVLGETVHYQNGYPITFWEYQPQGGEHEAPSEDIAQALFELHVGLQTYSAPIPSFLAELQSVGELLADADGLTALDDADRQLLQEALHVLLADLESAAPDEYVLHGSPHNHNVLAVAGRPHFIDFETVCTGPLEWDLAHVDPDVVAHYKSEIDQGVLDLCRHLVSVKTATWCWEKFDHPDMRWHTEHHLHVVRNFGR